LSNISSRVVSFTVLAVLAGWHHTEILDVDVGVVGVVVVVFLVALGSSFMMEHISHRRCCCC